MDCEVEEDLEFNVLVNDVEMLDDELDKELKEIEKENEANFLDEKPSKTNVETNIFEERDENYKHSDNKRTKKKTIYKKFDEHGFNERLESSDRHTGDYSGRRSSRDYYRTNNCDMYNQKMIDYKRLNKSLHVSKSSEPNVVGREIAYRLHEPKTFLFGHVVRVLGFQIASEIFAETKEIVKRGGIKTDSGDRKRSPGGTFLYLMKSRGYATPAQVKEIFKEDHESKKQQRKKTKQRNAIEQIQRDKKQMDQEENQENIKDVKKEVKQDVKKETKQDDEKRIYEDDEKKKHHQNDEKKIDHKDVKKEIDHQRYEKEIDHHDYEKEIQEDSKKGIHLDIKNETKESVKKETEPTDPNDSDSSTGEIL